MTTQINRNAVKKIFHKYRKIYKPLQEKQQEGMKIKGKPTESNDQTCASDITENKKIIQPQNILLKPEKTQEENRLNRFLGKKREKTKERYISIKEAKKKKNLLTHLKKEKINLHYIRSDDSNADNTRNKNEKSNKEENRTIFVRAYFDKMTKTELNEIFKKYGDISMIQVKSPKISLIEFKDKISADKVIKNKNKIFHKGRKLKVEYSKNQINDGNQSVFIKETENIELSESNDNTDKSELSLKKDDGDEDKFSYLEKKIKKLEKKYSKLEGKYEELEGKNKELEGKNNDLEGENEQRKNEINNLKIYTNIMSEINNQVEILSNNNFSYINNRLELILNSYKIIYMRKLSNLLLEQIYKKYSTNLSKAKVSCGKIRKTIIVVFEPINYPKKFDSYQVNLLIEYLRFIWDKSSSIIHVNDKDFPYQKEIFHEYLKGTIKTNKDKNINNNSISVGNLVTILFESNDEMKYNLNNNKNKNHTEENKISNLIEEMLPDKKSNSNDDSEFFFLNKKENGKFIYLSDTEESKESNYDIDENEVKKYIENNCKEFDFSSQLSKLIKLIKLNKDNKNYGNTITQINAEMFYKLWKNSFQTENIKKKDNYVKYIKLDKIQSLKEMGNLLCELLDGINVDVFVDDPKNIDKIIKTRIAQNKK